MKNTILVLLTLTLGALLYEIRQPDDRFEKVANKCLPTVVSIRVQYKVYDPFTESVRGAIVSGAGVMISADGHILTCAHLFNLPFERKAIATIETYEGSIVAGEVISISNKFDLALMKAPALERVKHIKLADPRKLRVGQEVIAIGHPLGLDFTVTHGIISALYRDISQNYNVTQSDVFMNPGNSGGPVINLQGELIGINSFIISNNPFFPTFTGLGFSVQVGQCLEFLVSSGQSINPHRRLRWLNILRDIKRNLPIRK